MSREFKITGVLHIEHINSGEIDIVCSDDGEISDGYHTMHELYQHRMALNVALFHAWDILCYNVMKSKLHHDGTMLEGYFIVAVEFGLLGQISYHYDLKHWDKFKIKEVERIPYEYDGHTSQDVIERLIKL